jgi:hypothetical protein
VGVAAVYKLIKAMINVLPWLPKRKHRYGKEQYREFSDEIHLLVVVPPPLLQSQAASLLPMQQQLHKDKSPLTNL